MVRQAAAGGVAARGRGGWAQHARRRRAIAAVAVRPACGLREAAAILPPIRILNIENQSPSATLLVFHSIPPAACST